MLECYNCLSRFFNFLFQSVSRSAFFFSLSVFLVVCWHSSAKPLRFAQCCVREECMQPFPYTCRYIYYIYHLTYKCNATCPSNTAPVWPSCKAGKQRDFGSNLLQLSFLFKSCDRGHCLVTLSLTVMKLSDGSHCCPSYMQVSFWW